jgi:hypothetical protein
VSLRIRRSHPGEQSSLHPIGCDSKKTTDVEALSGAPIQRAVAAESKRTPFANPEIVPEPDAASTGGPHIEPASSVPSWSGSSAESTPNASHAAVAAETKAKSDAVRKEALDRMS